jgi:U3 small nucleolar RNA-associated protein 21
MRLFMGALAGRLRARRDFEAVQTLQSVFLRTHGDVLIANAELAEALGRLRGAQRAESARVLELLAASLGTLGFVRDTM